MGRHQKKSKKTTKKKKAFKDNNSTTARSDSWVDNVRFQVIEGKDDDDSTKSTSTLPTTLSIISWNVLAEAYCSRYSQVHLPVQYQKVVFSKSKRKERIVAVLEQLCSSENSVDVACLQEVDLPEIGATLRSIGYTGVETPCVVGGGAGGRTDACALYVRSTARWQLVDHEIVRLDDLATLSTSTSSTANESTTSLENQYKKSSNAATANSDTSNVQGMQMSLLRRNMAVIARLQDTVSKQTVLVANAHLYWNPGFEYVKLCQAHYILKRVEQFRSGPNEPIVFCGDLNSRPGGVTHSYLSRGSINAKRVAPWYALAFSTEEDEENILADDHAVEKNDEKENGKDENGLLNEFRTMHIFDGDHNRTNDEETPRMRYLLDSSLNKLCRWLRILGQDVALETDEEEKLRTGKGEMVIFDRCKTERRTLVTTSPRLMQRRDCPPSVYCIHPPFLPVLEVALVHMLLTHGVVLEPSRILTRCVVCNGNIVEVQDVAEMRRVLTEYEAPLELIEDGMAVYECDGCRQGYWWNDLPTSSASRVKTAATRLLELCVRGGVPVREDGDGDGLFEHVNFQELRLQGWDYETPGSELLQHRLDVIDWLKHEHLECPFTMQSAYAHNVPRTDTCSTDESIVGGESLPFTNVTHQFVDTLDYIFFDTTRLKASERLYVPTCFRELGDGRTYIENAHLLPSDVWPSDHLAIGARLTFLASETTQGTNSALTVTSSIESTAVEEDDKHASNRAMPVEKYGSATPTEEPDSTNLPLQFCAPIGGGFSATNVPFPAIPQSHGLRCACGCVPAIPSLFEMAEMRKQAKLKAATGTT